MSEISELKSQGFSLGKTSLIKILITIQIPVNSGAHKLLLFRHPQESCMCVGVCHIYGRFQSSAHTKDLKPHCCWDVCIMESWTFQSIDHVQAHSENQNQVCATVTKGCEAMTQLGGVAQLRMCTCMSLKEKKKPNPTCTAEITKKHAQLRVFPSHD